MWYAKPETTLKSQYVMTRTEISDEELFNRDDVLVMIEPHGSGESCSWMEVGEAIDSDWIVVRTADTVQELRDELGKIAAEYGPRGIDGYLRELEISVTFEDGIPCYADADACVLRAEARRHPEQNEED